MARFGIRVVLLEPGLFRSGFNRNRVMGRHAFDPDSPYHGLSPKISKNSSGYDRWAGDSIKVARAIRKVLRAKKPGQRYAVGPDAVLAMLASRILPDRLLEYLVKRVALR